jgi:hypothetical protein
MISRMENHSTPRSRILILLLYKNILRAVFGFSRPASQLRFMLRACCGRSTKLYNGRGQGIDIFLLYRRACKELPWLYLERPIHVYLLHELDIRIYASNSLSREEYSLILHFADMVLIQSMFFNALLILSFMIGLSLQQECGPNKLCETGCCSKSNYCGFGPDYCGCVVQYMVQLKFESLTKVFQRRMSEWMQEKGRV